MNAEPRWLSDEEQEFWRLMLGSARRLDRLIEESLLSSAELSSAEFSVLVGLSEAEDQCLRLRDLCTTLGWDRSRASHQITRMERRDLVSKEKSPGDARGVIVRLTDYGMERLEKAVPDHVESVRRVVFDNLDPKDIPTLRSFFEGIMEYGDNSVDANEDSADAK